MVREANDRFGWFDLVGCTVRTETDLPALVTLNELARRARLTTKKSRKLSLSAKGHRAPGGPESAVAHYRGRCLLGWHLRG